ncbi:hypothetical protein ABZT08_01755 [Streptomyces sp. NPDC005526]|uniref:hypothetical protein n=1 Tax=Streptomyces sp. NPDC005526 TaxID=3156885 RepID=UPI0033B5A334
MDRVSSLRRARESLARAWWALDRVVNGPPRRPSRPLVLFAVHPVLSGLMGLVFFGGTAAVGIGRIYPAVVLWGAVMGLLTGLVAVVAGKKLEHYNFLPRER